MPTMTHHVLFLQIGLLLLMLKQPKGQSKMISFGMFEDLSALQSASDDSAFMAALLLDMNTLSVNELVKLRSALMQMSQCLVTEGGFDVVFDSGTTLPVSFEKHFLLLLIIVLQQCQCR